MPFEKCYTKDLGSNRWANESFLSFFGYKLTVEEDTRLRSSATPKYGINSDGKVYREAPPISSIYSEGIGTYTARLERNSATPKQLELEEKFIKAMGNRVLSKDWIWNSPAPPCPARQNFYKNRTTPALGSALSFILGLLIFIPCLVIFLSAVFAPAGLADEDSLKSVRVLLSLLGMLAAYPVGQLLPIFFIRTPSRAWEDCPQEVKDTYNRLYFNEIESMFPKEAADILKEYAIMMHYVSYTSIDQHKSSKLSVRTNWLCTCGRENAPYVSTCCCGINMRDIKPPEVSLSPSDSFEEPKAPRAPVQTNWRCTCGRENAPCVSTCCCGISKRDIKL